MKARILCASLLLVASQVKAAGTAKTSFTCETLKSEANFDQVALVLENVGQHPFFMRNCSLIPRYCHRILFRFLGRNLS